MKNKCLLILSCMLFGCDNAPEIDQQFTIAVIPDTQNYVDFTHQKNEGFAIDAAELFIEQMEYVAANTEARGGEIAFVTSVGDVWQNNEYGIDEEHFARGMRVIPYTDEMPREKLLAGIHEFELPLTRRGYDLIAKTGTPFSIAPGNHDYQYWWYVNPYPDDPGSATSLLTQDAPLDWHLGGYKIFTGVFGADSEYFNGKDWYVCSSKGGVNSAQIFEAGGYRFLHFAFEMQAGDDVLAWAQGVIDQHLGLPTIMSTHDFLNPRGERMPSPTSDLAKNDPEGHNHAEDIWKDWIKGNDQIFMILSGHQIGKATRIDQNDAGHVVYQLLSDYQGRHLAAGGAATGDGWLRLMEFDMSLDVPTLKVRTYSTYYDRYSNELADYTDMYRIREQSFMTDQEFIDADHFDIELVDFKARFGEPK